IYLGGAEAGTEFAIRLSFLILFAVIIGGLGSMIGSFFGAAFIVALPTILKFAAPTIGVWLGGVWGWLVMSIVFAALGAAVAWTHSGLRAEQRSMAALAAVIVVPAILYLVLPFVGAGFSAITGAIAEKIVVMVIGALTIFLLIVEPHGLARLWQITKQKLRVWPFPH
ncbi:MAG: hypothetical protein WCH83_16630, partial [Alphaproteobacteria bacterium]